METFNFEEKKNQADFRLVQPSNYGSKEYCTAITCRSFKLAHNICVEVKIQLLTSKEFFGFKRIFNLHFLLLLVRMDFVWPELSFPGNPMRVSLKTSSENTKHSLQHFGHSISLNFLC